MKRILTAMLTLAMLLAMISVPAMAEGQTNYTIIGGQSALSPGYNDNVVLNQLQEETGISIEWNTMSDSLSEQVNIHIAGGDLPDAFLGVGFSNYDLATYGEDGTFIDLTEYINADVMPNLTAILEQYPEFRAAITQADGCIYGLPSGDQMSTAGIGKEKDYNIGAIPQFSMINKVWLDDLGLEIPHHPGRAARRAGRLQGERHGRQDLRRGSRFHPAHVHRFRSVVLGPEHLLRRLRLHQLV